MISRRTSVILSSGMLLCSLVLTETKPVSENEAIPPHLNNTDLDQSSSSNTTTTVDVPGLTEDRDKLIITSHPNDDEDDCHHHHSILPIVPIVPLPSNDNGVVIRKQDEQEDKASTESNDSTKDTSNLKRVKRNKTRIRYRNKDLTRNTDY
jgi:hypothetical protein